MGVSNLSNKEISDSFQDDHSYFLQHRSQTDQIIGLERLSRREKKAEGARRDKKEIKRAVQKTH